MGESQGGSVGAGSLLIVRWQVGPRVRVDSLAVGARFLACDGVVYTYERRDGAKCGVHHVVGDNGKRTAFAGCAEVVRW